MKRYLLSLLIVWLSFIWFSSAENFTCEWSSWYNGATCIPNNFMLSESFLNWTHTISWNPNAEYKLYYQDENSNQFRLHCIENSCQLTLLGFSADDFLDYPEDFWPFSLYQSICINTDDLNTSPTAEFCNGWNSWWNEWWNEWWDEWWNEWWNWSDLWLISHLTPAVNWLWDTVVELIPYIVYIWIWVLLFTLWFYAIRRLVNWLSWKINSNFKSKRG